MDDRVAKLQPRVRALHRGQAGSQIRYPEDLRAEIIAVARAGRTAGPSVYRLAREIGVSAPDRVAPPSDPRTLTSGRRHTGFGHADSLDDESRARDTAGLSG